MDRQDTIFEWIDSDPASKSNSKLMEWTHFEWNVLGQLKLQDEIEIHMYISQTPCGDASIFPMALNENGLEEEDEPASKKRKLNEDIQRTGAKPVPSERDPVIQMIRM